MGVSVSTPVFEGPIDLLLHLVTSHQVDLLDVPLAPVVDAARPDLGNVKVFAVTGDAAPSGVERFDDLVRSGEAAPAVAVQVGLTDLAALTYTSGTSGTLSYESFAQAGQGTSTYTRSQTGSQVTTTGDTFRQSDSRSSSLTEAGTYGRGSFLFSGFVHSAQASLSGPQTVSVQPRAVAARKSRRASSGTKNVSVVGQPRLRLVASTSSAPSGSWYLVPELPGSRYHTPGWFRAWREADLFESGRDGRPESAADGNG